MAELGAISFVSTPRLLDADIQMERGEILFVNPPRTTLVTPPATTLVNYVKKFQMIGYVPALSAYKTWTVSDTADHTGTRYPTPGTTFSGSIDTLHSWTEVATPTIVPLALPRLRNLYVALDATQELYDTVTTTGTAPTGATPANGASVRSWGDIMGTHWDDGNSSSKAPLRRTTGMQGGRPALEFVLANVSRLNRPDTMPTWTGPRTIALAFQLTSLTLPTTYGYVFNVGNDIPIWLHTGAAGQSISWLRANGTSVGFGGINGAGLDLNRNTLVWRHDAAGNVAANFKATYNGVDKTLASSFSVSTFATNGVGASSDSSFPYPTPMLLQYAYVWNAYLTDAEVTQALTYMG
jgi:hypothetical protein